MLEKREFSTDIDIDVEELHKNIRKIVVNQQFGVSKCENVVKISGDFSEEEWLQFSNLL